MHSSARLFLWTQEDVERLAAFIGRHVDPGAFTEKHSPVPEEVAHAS